MGYQDLGGSDGKESTGNVGDLGWKDHLDKGKTTTPVFWPGEFHGLYSPWGGKEPDMTEQLTFTFQVVGASSPAFSLDFL